MNQKWFNIVGRIRTGTIVYMIAMLFVCSWYPSVVYVKVPSLLYDYYPELFEYMYYYAPSYILGMYEVYNILYIPLLVVLFVSVLGCALASQAVNEFAKMQKNDADYRAVLKLRSGYLMVGFSMVLSAIALLLLYFLLYFLPYYLLCLILFVISLVVSFVLLIAGITFIRQACLRLSKSSSISPLAAKSYKSLYGIYGWIFVSYFFGCVGVVVNIFCLFRLFNLWKDIREKSFTSSTDTQRFSANPLQPQNSNQSSGMNVRAFTDEKIRSIVDEPLLYNPTLVAACIHELEIREKAIVLKPTVEEFDLQRLNEVLSCPSMYSAELIYMCQVERAKRMEKIQEEQAQELARRAQEEEMRAQQLKAEAAEKQVVVEENKGSQKKWIWWITGSGLAVVIVFTILGIFLFKSCNDNFSYEVNYWEDAISPELTPDYSSYDACEAEAVCAVDTTVFCDTTDSSTGASTSYSSIYPGKYPQGSMRRLTADDLYGMSKWDLKVMRNEILARYGYIFKTDAMRDYFSQQSWYEPRYTEVNSMLTQLEWDNIDLIKQFEKR